jgi:hypothetical protein
MNVGSEGGVSGEHGILGEEMMISFFLEPRVYPVRASITRLKLKL